VDGPGSGSWQMICFGISSIEPLVPLPQCQFNWYDLLVTVKTLFSFINIENNKFLYPSISSH
jgi:hypothetical protein